ncbi:Hypothetical protein PP7435_CHR2-1215 [Komagataella phaffii CBS 7435]|uniref:Uncharacterized protein n=2 Tax=Komagataella phaffii TaxID=460519 RepID=C4QZM2_KOMPG|nr:uncharacterized protein PAS_chr2-1_0808 [Komagataella phaffii GS115]AOA61960.1 GQ67_00119T0 [Komagataella phaffii]CAH2448808.1 Hypothetical protein BQ9382_C2-6530 [Komagataella phaffii CBS 7435]AOA66985.1 GQ68_01269T0 [Komagataella phaffii GS115]CAY68696.1 hypothetical protein PAS_chr2-1_0808 [Komagataella phaffii GS115]CCA38890.1 Hypothetical protein PP7435_CHR2-1215 [Komagataella phaffii CBS 7435]
MKARPTLPDSTDSSTSTGLVSYSKRSWRIKKYRNDDSEEQSNMIQSMAQSTETKAPRRPKPKTGRSTEFLFVETSPQKLSGQSASSSSNTPKRATRMSRLFKYKKKDESLSENSVSSSTSPVKDPFLQEIMANDLAPLCMRVDKSGRAILAATEPSSPAITPGVTSVSAGPPSASEDYFSRPLENKAKRSKTPIRSNSTISSHSLVYPLASVEDIPPSSASPVLNPRNRHHRSCSSLSLSSKIKYNSPLKFNRKRHQHSISITGNDAQIESPYFQSDDNLFFDSERSHPLTHSDVYDSSSMTSNGIVSSMASSKFALGPPLGASPKNEESITPVSFIENELKLDSFLDFPHYSQSSNDITPKVSEYQSAQHLQAQCASTDSSNTITNLVQQTDAVLESDLQFFHKQEHFYDYVDDDYPLYNFVTEAEH